MSENEKTVTQEFEEALQQNNESKVEQDKQAFKDASAGTRVISETSGLLDGEYAHLEDLVDQNSKLKSKKNKLQTSFGMIVIFTVFVVIARVVAFTQGY